MKPGQFSVALKKLIIAPPPFVKFPHKDHPNSEVVPVIIVEQFNPSRQWSVKCADLLAVHRRLGSTSDPDVQEQLLAAGYRM